MKYRPHKGTLEKSMKHVVEVPGFKGLVGYLIRDFQEWGYVLTPEDVKLQPYGKDLRIGWEKVFLVAIRNKRHKECERYYFGSTQGPDYFGAIGYCSGDYDDA